MVQWSDIALSLTFKTELATCSQYSNSMISNRTGEDDNISRASKLTRDININTNDPNPGSIYIKTIGFTFLNYLCISGNDLNPRLLGSRFHRQNYTFQDGEL